MLNLKLKSVIKTALGVSIIYIAAIVLSLLVCDRVNELDSNVDSSVHNNNLVMNLK